MEEKRLTIDDERNALLKEQVNAVKKQTAAVQSICHAEKLHKLTQDQSILRQQQHAYRETLLNPEKKSKSEIKSTRDGNQQDQWTIVMICPSKAMHQ
jgi:CRISPR/Cas system CMR subunit Cmr6 (Cas7 group RAMP superfamily)